MSLWALNIEETWIFICTLWILYHSWWNFFFKLWVEIRKEVYFFPLTSGNFSQRRCQKIWTKWVVLSFYIIDVFVICVIKFAEFLDLELSFYVGEHIWKCGIVSDRMLNRNEMTEILGFSDSLYFHWFFKILKFIWTHLNLISAHTF